MRAIILILALFLIAPAKAQTAESDDSLLASQDTLKFSMPFEILAGTKSFKNSFYNQLNTIDKFVPLQPVNLIGIGYSGQFNVNRQFDYYGHMSLLFVVPKQVHIANQTAKLTGFVFSWSLYGIDFFPKNKNVDFILSSGFNTGRLRTYHNDSLRQKNPFFSPMVCLLPKFTIRKISFGLNLQCDYDVSSPNWRRTLFAHSGQLSIGKFQQTAITALFFVGWEP